jgi:hypothetical protein
MLRMGVDCGGLQPSELFSAAFQVRTGPTRSLEAGCELNDSTRACRLPDLFLQGRLPIQDYRKGYGSALCQRQANEETPAVRCHIAANKTKR